MAPPPTALVLLLFLVVTTTTATATSTLETTREDGACPGVKWKGGKQTVECRHRSLITLPSNVDPQTQVLDLTGSNLQTLPRDAFVRANLLNLQKVYLASCRIGQLDNTALRGLTNLVELDLSDNLLTDVPTAALHDAPSLRELRLNSNPIQKLETRAFESAPSLVKLDLSDCRIESLAPGAFDGIDQLSHLRLQGNRLQEMRPDVVSSLPARLHGLELAGNPWICDCRNRFLRQWLHQHNVPSPATALCDLPVRLAGKPLIELQPDDFACAPHVIVVLSTTPPHQHTPTSVTGPAAPLQTGTDWANGAGGGGKGGHYMHVEASAGENATLTCRMSGVPAPDIAWLWRGRPLNNGSLVPVDDPDVALGHSSSDFDTSSEASSSFSTKNSNVIDDSGPRTVVIQEDGKYEKTSRLILSPAREIDSGEYVCVASNAAGLARANLTLRVDIQAPVVGGLGGAQIAGLGAGLLILLATVIAILFVMLVRTRKAANGCSGGAARASSSSHHASINGLKRGDSETGGIGSGGGRPAGLILNGTNGIHPTLAAAAEQHVIKSPSLSALEYGHVTTFVDRSGSHQQQQQHVMLLTSRQPQSPGQPDLVQHDIPQFQVNNYSSDYGDYATMGTRSNCNGPVRDILSALGAATGDYQSAQTDSFYPSALWDHQQYDQEAMAATSSRNNSNMLPHVPLTHHHHHQIISNPAIGQEDECGGEVDSVSVDSYNLPCRIPQQQEADEELQQQQLDTSYVPYPADFGLPRAPNATIGRLTTTSMSSSGASSAESIIPSAMSAARFWSAPGGNNNNRTPSAATASPILAAKLRGPKPQQGPRQQQHHHLVARDSPDEGYQEECATDV